MPTFVASRLFPLLLAVILAIDLRLARAAEAARPAGVVSHIKVLSDKVPDVSSLEAWKKSFIKDGMSALQ